MRIQCPYWGLNPHSRFSELASVCLWPPKSGVSRWRVGRVAGDRQLATASGARTAADPRHPLPKRRFPSSPRVGGEKTGKGVAGNAKGVAGNGKGVAGNGKGVGGTGRASPGTGRASGGNGKGVDRNRKGIGGLRSGSVRRQGAGGELSEAVLGCAQLGLANPAALRIQEIGDDQQAARLKSAI